AWCSKNGFFLAAIGLSFLISANFYNSLTNSSGPRRRISMRISCCIVTVAAQLGLAMLTTLAHPGSGIVVDAANNVYFTHTGHGAGKIDAQGKLSYVHKDTGGH